MITLFEKFKDKPPFIQSEYMIFYYIPRFVGYQKRFENHYILVNIKECEINIGIKNSNAYSVLYSKEYPKRYNFLLTIIYDNITNEYLDVLDYKLKLIWRGFDKDEAIKKINMLNNTEKFNL